MQFELFKVFDNVNLRYLVNRLNLRVLDSRFSREIQRMFNAGLLSLDISETTYLNLGIFQGSLFSPFLFNVYMHELDEFVVNLIRKNKVFLDQKKSYPLSSTKYLKNPCIQYVRYGVAFLIGLSGSLVGVYQVRNQISNFLKSTLHLYIKKVIISHISKGPIKFLGHVIQLTSIRDTTKEFKKEVEIVVRFKKKVLALFEIKQRQFARIQVLDMRRRFLNGYRKLAEEFGLS